MDDPAQPQDELQKIEAAIQAQETLRGILPDDQLDKIVKTLQDQKEALLAARQEVDIRTRNIKGKEVNVAGHDVTKIVVEKGAKLVLGRDVNLDEEPARSNLPHQASFFGRQKELEIIANELSPESRTWGVLIDGPGGIGKTALALRAGQMASEELFPLKIFLSAKVRELTPSGEQALQDFMFPNYMSLLTELGRELGNADIGRSDPQERTDTVRRLLASRQALIIVDNVETFVDAEQVRLYQFLSRLPASCKAIITSRRRRDIDARVLRLDRMERQDALALLEELAATNRYLSSAPAEDRLALYEITQGNPLLIKWAVGQLGRTGSQCRTIAEVLVYLQNAPRQNDPLEYIFGDLVDTFTPSETAVLAALSYFNHPAKVDWVAALANLPKRSAQTALEDLADRALLSSDAKGESFLLPSLTGSFLRRSRPDVVQQAGSRLGDKVYALVMENGYDSFDRLPNLETEWEAISAALPVFIAGENGRLHTVCDALRYFFDFFGHWDEWLSLSQKAEEKAVGVGDLHNAGWRAYWVAWVYYLEGKSDKMLAPAERCLDYFQRAHSGLQDQANAIRLRGNAYVLKGQNETALIDFKKALESFQSIQSESVEVSYTLSDIAEIEKKTRDFESAKRDYEHALRIARKIHYAEGVANYTGNLASLALDQENWAEAEKKAREALVLAEAVGRQELVALDHGYLALALIHLGRAQEALPDAQKSVEILTRLGSTNLDWASMVLSDCEEALKK